MFNEKRLLIFDFDGVLVDSIEPTRAIYDSLHTKYHLPPFRTKADVVKLFEHNVFKSLIKLGLTQTDMNDLIVDFREELLQRGDQLVPFPGIMESLQKLSNKITRLAIVSSNYKKVVENFLERNGIVHLFLKILTAEHGISKAKKIKTLIEEFDCSPNNVFYIGDTIGDILEAREAKVRSVAVCWGYHGRKELEAKNPDFILDDPIELTTL